MHSGGYQTGSEGRRPLWLVWEGYCLWLIQPAELVFGWPLLIPIQGPCNHIVPNQNLTWYLAGMTTSPTSEERGEHIALWETSTGLPLWIIIASGNVPKSSPEGRWKVARDRLSGITKAWHCAQPCYIKSVEMGFKWKTHLCTNDECILDLYPTCLGPVKFIQLLN